MKTKLKLFFIIILFPFIFTAPQATEDFPIGAWVTNYDLNYGQLLDLGFNIIISKVSGQKNDSLAMFDTIIGSFPDTSCYPYKYTGAYYTVKSVPDFITTDLDDPGFRQDIGTSTSNYVYVDSGDTPTGLLIHGPYYTQQRKHQMRPYHYGDPVKYTAKFRMKLLDSIPNRARVCEIRARYVSPVNSCQYEAECDTIQETGYEPPRKLIYSGTADDELSTTWKEFEISYQIPEYIGPDRYSDFSVKTVFEGPDYDPLEFTSDPDGTGCPFGIKLSVEWLGDGLLCVDTITIFDSKIGYKFYEDISAIDSIIAAFDNNFGTYVVNIDEFKYWYGLDEPHTIDHYQPFNIVDDAISQGNRKMHTAFYPQWTGTRNNEPTVGRWIDEAEPTKLMYYYYPYKVGKTGLLSLAIQHNILNRLIDDGYDMSEYYFTPQANAFWNDDYVQINRYPTNSEFNAQSLLALAGGAKGLVYWTYYSYSNDIGYRCRGFVDTLKSGYQGFEPLEIWNFSKDTLIPRIRNNFQDILLNSDYTGQSYVNRREGGATINVSDELNDLTFDVPLTDYSFIFSSMLENRYDQQLKHYFILNLSVDSLSNTWNTKEPSVTFYSPFSSYTNIHLYDADNTFDSTYVDSLSVDLELPEGDGYLFSMAPSVRKGGEIISDETISGTDTLDLPLRVTNNAQLKIYGNYYIGADMIVDSGAVIVDSSQAFLDLIDSAKIHFHSWDVSLLLFNDNNHPKLVFGEYPDDSVTVQYHKVYRKLGGDSWSMLDTVSGNEYTDDGVSIIIPGGQSGITAYYKVTAITIPKQGRSIPSESGYSNTKEVDVQGEEIGKIAHGIPTEFSLFNNYPNPFNPSTSIRYDLPEPCHVRINIFNILGKLVDTIVDKNQPAGRYSYQFNAGNLSSGVYIYEINAGKFKQRKKMLLLK